MDGHISFPLLMPVKFNIRHTTVLIHNTNAHELLSDSHKYFTSLIHIGSFTFMIPHLAVIFVFSAMKVLLQFINILHLAATFFFHINDTLCIPCLVAIFLFFLSHANNY